ncbi:Alpha/Beta hydrolase protein [Triangularia verruculosa]|uniref:Alpha/Beta hydrolase protein n=1 Tax=Triangularia verruculosa TaxID=2587418 RepID=A0AAN7AXF1_9PEZI|nr:Alpha/Beta hydrolase protein [Triangularia verruculosa]
MGDLAVDSDHAPSTNDSQTYHIASALHARAPHHVSFQQLWETKWKAPCSMGVYPFMFGTISDFQPVIDTMTAAALKEPYDWDEYASMFFPQAFKLAFTAQQAEQDGEREKACEYYLRSSALYRIARFPAPRSPKQLEAWNLGKQVFYKGASLLPNPILPISIPHTHNLPSESSTIPASFLCPPANHPLPLLIIFTGLDGYRTELAVWQSPFASFSIATLVVEIPGTGDSPADPSDPTSPERQWSSLLDWIAAQPTIDQAKIIVWGFSTGGYYSLRAAHTHPTKLLGAVSLGGGCHRMFDETWLRNVNNLEYPFDLAHTLAHKFGYGNDLDQFIKEGRQKFSLVDNGILDKPCCKTLMVNGDLDEIFPVEDLYLAVRDKDGKPRANKEFKVVKGRKHMGEPESFGIILDWIHGLWGLKEDLGEFKKGILGGLPFKPKY